MTIFTLLDAQLAFGMQPLLDRANLAMQTGERIGLVGRNGTGKSSLLHIISATQALDDGELQISDGLRVAFVEQEPQLPPAETLRESLIQRMRLDDHHDERDRWRIEARLAEYLHRFGLDVDMPMERLSGGERKRAALAAAFALEPELLLFDEPTNHLDIAGIELLEETLLKAPAAIVVTHDRFFLDRIATRIVELDRGALRSYPGNFSTYERLKADQLAAEEIANRKFDKFWAQEEVWIRKGVEARRTRNEGRVRRLESLRNERGERRQRMGNVKMSIGIGDRSGKLVAELVDVSKRFGDKCIVDNLSMRIMRGDRLAFIGPNGVGKTTLIKIILGQLMPDEGHVRLGTNLNIAYFDQMREQLDPERTVAETISPGSDWVEVNGQRKHVMSYLGDFLFPPRRVNSPVKLLSGGERNRLLLARLFARPANLLVLDEPTNDLDIDSLELLESTLQDYNGTLLLVSHDRAFLDNVATQTLVAEGDGKWKEYVGGYSDWLTQRPQPEQTSKEEKRATSAAPQSARKGPKIKLSYKEQRELDALPGEIEALEQEQRALAAKMSDASYHTQDAAAMKADQTRAEEIETQLVKKLERWEALEEKVKGSL